MRPVKDLALQKSAADCSGLQPFAMDCKHLFPLTREFWRPCFTALTKEMSTPSASEMLPDIEGVEQLPEPIPGSKPFTKIYYRELSGALVADVSKLPVRENHFIAPAIGWPKRIYRKPTEAAK